MTGIITTENRIANTTPGAYIYTDRHFNGVAYARNEVLHHLYNQGHEYISLCDDDLIYNTTDCIQRVIDVMKSENLLYTCLPNTLEGKREDVNNNIEKWDSYIGAFYILHRSVLDEVGYFSSEFKGYGWEDVHYKHRLHQRYGDIVNPKILPYLISSMDVLGLNPTPSISNKEEQIELYREVFLKEVNNGQIYYPYPNS